MIINDKILESKKFKERIEKENDKIKSNNDLQNITILKKYIKDNQLNTNKTFVITKNIDYIYKNIHDKTFSLYLYLNNYSNKSNKFLEEIKKLRYSDVAILSLNKKPKILTIITKKREKLYIITNCKRCGKKLLKRGCYINHKSHSCNKCISKYIFDFFVKDRVRKYKIKEINEILENEKIRSIFEFLKIYNWKIDYRTSENNHLYLYNNHHNTQLQIKKYDDKIEIIYSYYDGNRRIDIELNYKLLQVLTI